MQSERAVSEGRIEAERVIKEREIARAKSLELAEQDKAIALAERSKAQSEAQAEADAARALAARAEEQVATARAIEVAERQRNIDLVEAQKVAQRDAIGLTVQAEAEKKAAQDRAEALRTGAQGEADAEKLRAEATRVRLEAEAEGREKINAAENTLSPQLIEMQIKQALIEALPRIIAESVKPMERIDAIKILQVNGLNGQGGNAGAQADGGNGSLAEEVVNSALRYRAQAPLVDSLMKELGLQGGDLQSLANSVTPTTGTPTPPVTPSSANGTTNGDVPALKAPR